MPARTRNGTTTVSGTLYNRIDGEPLIAFKYKGKWHAAEIASGYSITPRGFTTRNACMIESHKVGQREL